jgi:hypothetical protein
MELPFLKRKQKMQGGAVVEQIGDLTNKKALMEHIADELLNALERKDIKEIRESIKALVLLIKEEDQTQDSGV